jgi:acetyltransferase-like isoleucine patch superfamily enzyme
MKKLIIIGTGAHAAEIEQYIYDNNSICNEFEIIGFVSNSYESYLKYNFRHPFLGEFIGKDYIDKNISLIVAFSNIKFRIDTINYYKELGYSFLNFIHHTSKVFSSVKMGEGNIICPYCQLGPNVTLGSFNTFNNKASVGHDSVIGNNNIFCPNIGLSGNTIIGDANFFSLNVATIPNVSIGDNNVIAPNMVIEKSIKSNSTFFHRFKETVLFTTSN